MSYDCTHISGNLLIHNHSQRYKVGAQKVIDLGTVSVSVNTSHKFGFNKPIKQENPGWFQDLARCFLGNTLQWL